MGAGENGSEPLLEQADELLLLAARVRALERDREYHRIVVNRALTELSNHGRSLNALHVVVGAIRQQLNDVVRLHRYGEAGDPGRVRMQGKDRE